MGSHQNVVVVLDDQQHNKQQHRIEIALTTVYTFIPSSLEKRRARVRQFCFEPLCVSHGGPGGCCAGAEITPRTEAMAGAMTSRSQASPQVFACSCSRGTVAVSSLLRNKENSQQAMTDHQVLAWPLVLHWVNNVVRELDWGRGARCGPPRRACEWWGGNDAGGARGAGGGLGSRARTRQCEYE